MHGIRVRECRRASKSCRIHQKATGHGEEIVLWDARNSIIQVGCVRYLSWCYSQAPTRLSDTSGNVPQEIKIRKVKPGQEMSFVKNVDDYMHFTENENRPNLQRSLDMAGDSKSLLVISVSVKLQGTYSSHQYDFLYSGLSFYPEIN